MLSGSTCKLFNFFTENDGKSLPTLEKPYIFFDLNLSESQRDTLANLKITRNSEFDNNGDLENMLDKMEHFISHLDIENAGISLKIAEIILGLINSVINEMHQETAWVVLRASTPNEVFKTPRWHIDGHYFPPHEGEQLKVVTTLAGPGTLFYDLPDEKREAFYSIDNDRIKVNEMLKDAIPVSTAFNQGAAFISGSKSRAAIHSEPYINSPRLFLAMAPCSRSQYKAKMDFQAEMENNPAYQEMIEKARLAFKPK
jgi:hypothetical protein